MGEQKKQRLLYIDILNILACLAVISLHHNGLVHSFEDTLAWRESLVVECGLYWAVPVFLMIMQIASPNGHLCHIRRPLCDLIGGQPGTH